MCIFCKIVNGEIPSYKVYEDEQILAFLDISQVTKGHTLVIPKKHYDNYLACDDEILAHLTKQAKMIGNHIIRKTGAKGMHVLSNIHEQAGQTVMHFHLHLIPRYRDDDACNIQFLESETQDLQTLSQQLKVK